MLELSLNFGRRLKSSLNSWFFFGGGFGGGRSISWFIFVSSLEIGDFGEVLALTILLSVGARSSLASAEGEGSSLKLPHPENAGRSRCPPKSG